MRRGGGAVAALLAGGVDRQARPHLSRWLDLAVPVRRAIAKEYAHLPGGAERLRTTAPFIVYTSNVCATLGLRSMFFAVAGIMKRFHYLHYGLAAVLVFVGTNP